MDNQKIGKKMDLIYGDMFRDKYVRMRLNIYNSLLKPFLKSKIKVLDIGCYTGDLLRIFPSQIDYYGIDIDESALEIAKKRGAKVIKLDLENETIPLKQEFDIILATELLEHLKDPERLIEQIKHLLKEDGVVLVSLPNECTIYHRIKVLFGKGIDGTGFACHYHLHFPTIKQNDEFIRKHFKIIGKRYWIHTDVGGILGKILGKVSDKFWLGLAHFWPSLFARGVIYLCRIGLG